MTSLLFGKTRDWLIGDDISGCVLCVTLDRQLYSVLNCPQNLTTDNKAGSVKQGTGVTVDVNSEERSSDLPGRWKHVTSFVIWSEGHAIGWLEMTSVVAFFAWYLTSNFTVYKKPHYRQQGRVCKAGTVITVDVSSKRTHFPPAWSVTTRDQLHD